MTRAHSRSVLMIAYHFPPFVGSSGVHRTLKFCNYLRESGWQPIVLTVEPRAYVQTSEDSLAEIPADVPVYRSFCLDAARHLAVQGRHPAMLALPDRWVSWWPSGVRRGLQVIKEHQPAAIWSTYPVATAHLIAATLSRTADLPWIADFRDWMTDADYPAGRLKRAVYRRIEQSVLTRCDAAVFTTESSRGLYQERYPGLNDANWVVLPNGYDEADFEAERAAAAPSSGSIRLLHSGYVYPEDRDPSALFAAVSFLKSRGELAGRNLSVMFRGPGDAERIRRAARRHGVLEQVATGATASHGEAVREMLAADALVLIQGRRFERQVPAKAYEYLRATKPVLVLSSEQSEARRLMEGAGCGYCADMGCPEEIAAQLLGLMRDLEAGKTRLPADNDVLKYERRHQAGILARILDRVTVRGPARGELGIRKRRQFLKESM